MLCLRVEIIFLFSYILQVSYLNKKNKEKHKVGNKCPLSLLESHCGQVERFISVFLCFNKCITHRSGLVSSTHMTLFLVQTRHCPFHRSEKVLLSSCWPDVFYPHRKSARCLLIRWGLGSTPSPRPRVGGSAGRTERSCGHTVDRTPLIRRGTSGGRTAAAA